MADKTVAYRLVREAEWKAAQTSGAYPGSAVDERDNFMHMSPATEVRGTARRYYAGATDLVLLKVGELYLRYWKSCRCLAILPAILWLPAPPPDSLRITRALRRHLQTSLT